MTRQEETINELLASFDFTTAGPDPYREVLVKAWNAGAHYAVVNDWDEDTLAAYLEDPEALAMWEDNEEPDDDPAYAAYLAEQEKQCGADYVTRGSDPYATSCDQPKGHYPATAHDAPSPFEGDNHRITWMGGGSVAGDATPYTNVEWYTPVASKM